MKELLIATRNSGKVTELTALLADMGITLYSLEDFPDLHPVIEDGETFADNAVKKALTACHATGLPVVADDSGLMVDALGGRPGVHSARYAGEDAGDADNNSKLLFDLRGISQERRTASFSCVIALCTPDETCRTFCGDLRGFILEKTRGSGGFGYDPLFMVPEYGKTLAELPLEIKNRISHRGRAFANLKSYLFQDLPGKSKA